MDGSQAAAAFREVWQAAETHGKTIYDELLVKYRERLAKSGRMANTALRTAGLSSAWDFLPCRAYRLAQLEQEERAWPANRPGGAEVEQPELVPLLLVRVEGREGG